MMSGFIPIFVYLYDFSAGGSPPPPGTEVRITDSLDDRITDNGDRRITD